MAQEKLFQSQQDPQWINKTRTLIVSSKGINAHQRHFILSLFAMLPHAKKDYKLQKYRIGEQINELCQQNKARYFMYFEVKKQRNFSVWIGKYPQGPSVKMLIDGVVLNKDVKFQGNSVKGARHVLSFDNGFQSNAKLRLVKELLTGAFNVPKMHPKSTAVIDHTLNFTTQPKNDIISFKNYQIFRQAVNKQNDKIELFQIGPRFMMQVQVILDGVVSGQVLYRAPIIKKVLKKSKLDPRKNKEAKQIGEINLFGEEQQFEEQN